MLVMLHYHFRQRALALPCNSSASIGIALRSVGYESPGDVLRNADIAMCRAKAAPRARFAVFDAGLRAQWAAQVNLPRDLRKARPRVKVSGTDMCHSGFVMQVADALLANGLEAQQLTPEITESTLMHRLDSAPEVMGRLREIGVGLSVADFGTGYSSLSYLSTLPITSLKIDQSFVQRLEGQDPHGKDTEVVRAVITLGRALGKTVIAEGIETPAQLAQLIALGCEFGQGYLLSRPLSPAMACAMAQADGQSAPTSGGLAPAAEQWREVVEFAATLH